MSRLEYDPSDRNREEEEREEARRQEENVPDAQRHRLALPDEEAIAQNEADSEEKRLRYIDQLLKNAPILAAPLGFADRVMDALRKQSQAHPLYRDALGIIAGLGILACLVLPLLGFLSLQVFIIILDAAARDAAADDVREALNGAWTWLQDPSLNTSTIILLLIIFLMFLLLSGYLLRFFRQILTTDEA